LQKALIASTCIARPPWATFQGLHEEPGWRMCSHSGTHRSKPRKSCSLSQ
jgi:hypothetical protein